MADLYSSISGLLTEFDARSTSSLWQDTGKSTSVSDGDSVRVWVPSAKGSLSDDAVAPSDTARPVYRSSVAATGYPGLEFDAVDDVLSIAHNSAYNGLSGLTVLCVCRLNNLPSWDGVFGKFQDPSWTIGWGVMTSGGSSILAGTDNWNRVSHPVSTGQTLVFAMRGNASTQQLWVNDTIAAVASGGYAVDNSTATIELGGLGSGAGLYRLDGYLHHVLICSEFLSSSQMAAAMYYLGQIWGVSVTAPLSSGGLLRVGMNGGFGG